jgi:hypothetical protein
MKHPSSSLDKAISLLLPNLPKQRKHNSAAMEERGKGEYLNVVEDNAANILGTVKTRVGTKEDL